MNHPKRVLVCDDEPHIVHIVASKLRNAGLQVITAGDGQEALDLARSHRPDLVFTDYQMPFLSGLELCAKLASDPATCHIPAILLTARGFSLDREDLSHPNIRKVLVKPFSPREVLRTAQEMLQADSAAAEAQPS